MHHSQSQKTSKASPKANKGAPAAATKGKSAKATGSKPKKTEKVRLAPSFPVVQFFSLFAYLRRDSLRNAKRAQSSSLIISQIF